MKKNKIIALVSSVVIALALISCSSPSSPSTNNNETTNNSESPENPTDSGQAGEQSGEQNPETPETPTDSGSSGEESDITFSVKNKLTIGGKTYEKTKEVVVIASGTTETICMEEDPVDYHGTGVFIKDRSVTLSPFLIGAYEVTQELYNDVMGNNPSYYQNEIYPVESDEEQRLRPVEKVTWYDAVYFCNELTKKLMSEEHCVYTITNDKKTGNHITSADVTIDIAKKGYRLPTEAEWEFAARGGNPKALEWKYAYAGVETEKTGSFISGSIDTSLGDYGWYFFVGQRKTHEVGMLKPNTLNLYDMSGNVCEWCNDWLNNKYDDPITTESITDPIGPKTGESRINRGGSCENHSYVCSVSVRIDNAPDIQSELIGFRLVRSLK